MAKIGERGLCPECGEPTTLEAEAGLWEGDSGGMTFKGSCGCRIHEDDFEAATQEASEEEDQERWCSHCSGTGIGNPHTDSSCRQCGGSGIDDRGGDDDGPDPDPDDFDDGETCHRYYDGTGIGGRRGYF